MVDLEIVASYTVQQLAIDVCLLSLRHPLSPSKGLSSRLGSYSDVRAPLCRHTPNMMLCKQSLQEGGVGGVLCVIIMANL